MTTIAPDVEIELDNLDMLESEIDTVLEGTDEADLVLKFCAITATTFMVHASEARLRCAMCGMHY
jgi:hypothetical protein